MEQNFLLCKECFNALDKVGIAREAYLMISASFIEKGHAFRLMKNDTLIKFLEKKGYVVTHEHEERLYVKPSMKSYESDHILCCSSHSTVEQ